MAKLTQEEFMNKYGNEKVVFTSYYKYSFCFKGKLGNGHDLTVHVGGNADDIYREEVAAGVECVVYKLYPYSGQVYDNTEEIESFYNY